MEEKINRLMFWSDQLDRDLPWKENITPYRVWVSEIMLQQTQVATVVEQYFERFVQTLPSIEALAEADEKTVLQLWEGLGYYSRARNLRAAAQNIIRDFGGRFPDSVEEACRLPGIGRYTAGAIVSIAYGKPAPILEANTIRVHARMLDITEPVAKSSVQSVLWDTARLWVTQDTPFKPGKINQALMELGQLVCRKIPLCEKCPLQSECRGFLNDRQKDIPVLKPPVEPCACRHVMLMISDRRGRLFAFQHSADDRWSGLWDFPRFEIVTQDDDENKFFVNPQLKIVLSSGAVLEEPLEERFKTCFGLPIQVEPEPFCTFRHSVTRYRIELRCYGAKTSEDTETDGRWFDPVALLDLPLTAPARKAFELWRKDR